MNVSICDIENFLVANKFDYLIINRPNKIENFIPASIFEPIEYGFYYYVGNKLKINITNSIIFVPSDFVKYSSSNCYIILKGNVQFIFYSFLKTQFEEKSNGKISNLSFIDAKAKIGNNVQIDPFCVIGKVEIGDNCIIKAHSVLKDNTKIRENVVIESHCCIGATGSAWVWEAENIPSRISLPQLGGVVIEKNSFIGSNCVVVRGSLNESTIIGEDCIVSPGCKFGHGSKIGKMCHFANNVSTGGNTIIGNFCFLGSSSTIKPKIRIDDFTIVGAGAVVVKNSTEKGLLLKGLPAKEYNYANQLSGIPNLLNWKKIKLNDS